MRVPVFAAIAFLVATGTCRADDPLESLNTVQETLSQLAQHRTTHSSVPAAEAQHPRELSSLPAVPSEERETDPASAPPPIAEDPASCCQEPPPPQ